MVDILVTVILFFIIIQTFQWIIHIEMTTKNSYNWGWASYRKFKKEFEKHEFEKQSKGNYIDGKSKSQICSSIIKFNYGKGMVISDPVSWTLVHIYLNKMFQEPKEKKQKRIKW